MLAKVMSGNSGWDVVFPSAEYIQPMRDMGLLAAASNRNGFPTWMLLTHRFAARLGIPSCAGAFLTCGASLASFTRAA